MRTMAVGTLSVVAALGIAAVTAEAQTGATQYGGVVTSGRPKDGIGIGLTRAADGSVAARLDFAVSCHGILYEGVVVKAGGKTTGTGLRFSGHTKVGGRYRLSMTGTGTFSGAAATGRLSATPIRSDGSFSRSETYKLPDDDGSHLTSRVTFAGHFLSGGAGGTLTASVQLVGKHGRRFKPCRSGTQTWTATP